MPVGTDRDAAHAAHDGVGGIVEKVLHQMEWQLRYRRCVPAAALRVHRAQRRKAKSPRRKPLTSRSVSSLKPPQAFEMGAILGPVPRSGKHGAIAFSRTAARCHNVTKTEVDSSRVPGTRVDAFGVLSRDFRFRRLPRTSYTSSALDIMNLTRISVLVSRQPDSLCLNASVCNAPDRFLAAWPFRRPRQSTRAKNWPFS